jgi:hypothetical protein
MPPSIVKFKKLTKHGHHFLIRHRGDDSAGFGGARVRSTIGAVANGRKNRTVLSMSTVMEIESALEKLPVDAQREVAAWLESKLWPETPAMLAGIDEAERSLSEEGGVPVEEVRKNLSQWITG